MLKKFIDWLERMEDQEGDLVVGLIWLFFAMAIVVTTSLIMACL